MEQEFICSVTIKSQATALNSLNINEQFGDTAPHISGTGINSIVSKLNLGTDKDMLASVWIPSLAAIIFVTANLFYGIRKHKSMYTAYLVVYLILNTSFDWVISVPRYMTCAIPAFLFLSDFSERHKWTEPIITASMAIGLGIYLTGYLCWKQIL